jgi:hypothetical protein
MLMGMRRGRFSFFLSSLVTTLVLFFSRGLCASTSTLGGCLVVHTYIHIYNIPPTVVVQASNFVYFFTALLHPACYMHMCGGIIPGSIRDGKYVSHRIASHRPTSHIPTCALPLWLGIHPNEYIPAQFASQSANGRAATRMHHLLLVYLVLSKCTLGWYCVLTNPPLSPIESVVLRYSMLDVWRVQRISIEAETVRWIGLSRAYLRETADMLA